MTRAVGVRTERRFSGQLARRATADKVLNVKTVGDVPSRTLAARLSMATFRSVVWKYWKENGRHDLPWRKTKDPYRIMVSEVMLQQTQVPRVKEKYKEFLKKFPSVRALAKASLSDVLKVWSGLGYNRRGKYLYDAAKIIVAKYGGKVPRDLESLRSLPGMGPYTASAVRVFAFNEPDVLIETNVRSVFIHHFFQTRTRRVLVPDSEVRKIAERAAKGQDPRTWQSALFDYGVHLKKLHKNPSRKSAHYTKQSKFEGSPRQIRGAILRALANGPKNQELIYRPIRANRPIRKTQIALAFAGLVRDGLIVKEKEKWRIA
jgi:A/G-specific adenine glycosylase